jgi:hypothetical protein
MNDGIRCRALFDNIGKTLGIKNQSEWYLITKADITRHGGILLLQKYKNSPFELLQLAYPEKEWNPFKFSKYRFWTIPANRRLFFESLKNHLHFTSMEGFYNLSLEQFGQYGGWGLLQVFGGSLYKALLSSYPQHEWLPWRFSRVPLGYWKVVKNQRYFMDWLGKELGFTTMSDWYRVKAGEISNRFHVNFV